MRYINYHFINEYLEFLIEDLDFIEIRKYAENNNIPIMDIVTKNFLVNILNTTKPKKILEIGSAIGYSALVFEKYSDAEITTIELDRETYIIAKNNFKDYNANINIINEDANKALDNLNQGFDFVFIDANKSNCRDYFDKCSKLIDKSGIIICDNVLFKGQVTNDNLAVRRKNTIIKRLREFLDYLINNEDFSTSIIPIGDGLTISC